MTPAMTEDIDEVAKLRAQLEGKFPKSVDGEAGR
jgi:hypothetical protein